MSYLPDRPTRARRLAAFTLVEILIVVVILGILAFLVLPRVVDAATGGAQTVFITNGRSFVQGAEIYMAQTGDFIEDASSGQVPAGLEEFVDESRWTGGTPIGGVWDAQLHEMGVVSAIGVHFNGTGPTRDDAYMTEIDRLCDDGNLATGGFRKLANDRYYFVIR